MSIRYFGQCLLLASIILVGGLVVFPNHTGSAQTEDPACSGLVRQALDGLGNNCGGMGRNSACYGYNRVDATFSQEVDETYFSTPADRSQLVELQSIATTPLDTAQDFWGIAVLNVQANVPNSLPGQAVTFLLLGDVEVENEVAPENALLPVEPINLTTLVGANLRSRPSSNANVIVSAAAGTNLVADGISPDGEWLRVLYESGPAWINRQTIQPEVEGSIATLPTITNDTRSPMQAFSFHTGVSDVACESAPPSLLVVQGPQTVAVDITANGTDIRIHSTIALRFVEGNKVQIVVLSGAAEIGNITIPAGFTIFAEITPEGDIVPGTWSNFRPLTEEELEELKPLEGLTGDFMHYNIRIPTLEEIQAILQQFAATSGSSGLGGSSGPAAGQADCSNFAATSPLGGLGIGSQSYFWDGAPGATSYRVNVYANGQLIGSSETSGPVTSLNADLTIGGPDGVYSWEVIALVNGQEACSTAQVTMLREASPPVQATNVPLTPEQICNATPGCSWDGQCYCN